MSGKSLTKLGSVWNILIYRFGFAEAEKFCTVLKRFHQIKSKGDSWMATLELRVIAGKKVQQWHQR